MRKTVVLATIFAVKIDLGGRKDWEEGCCVLWSTQCKEIYIPLLIPKRDRAAFKDGGMSYG